MMRTMMLLLLVYFRLEGIDYGAFFFFFFDPPADGEK